MNKPNFRIVTKSFFEEIGKIIELPKGVTKMVITASLKKVLVVDLTLNAQYPENPEPMTKQFTLTELEEVEDEKENPSKEMG